jgi:CheY-like chemotaxis protein
MGLKATQRIAVLIDDDEDDLDLLGETILLIDPAVFCIKFKCPVEAMNILSAQQIMLPDYIFIDINMPRMNGRDCLAALRKLSQYKTTVIVVLSTSMGELEENILLGLGADHVFQKPNEYASLNTIVGEILQAD